MSTAGDKLHSGEAWREFCDRLKAVGDTLLTDGYATDPRERAEGYRALTRLLGHAMKNEVQCADPLFPEIMRDEEPHMQWGGPNPDNTYYRAAISPGHEYRVWGNLRGVRELIFSLNEGDMQLMEFGVFSEKTLADIQADENGDFELWISAREREGNWMQCPENARLFLARIYISDWANDASPPLHIERVGAEGVPPTPLDPAALAGALDRTATWLEKSVPFWNHYTTGQWQDAEKNVVRAAGSTPGGAQNIKYGSLLWELEQDDAIVVTTEVPDASYWNFCIHTMHWLESGDMANRQVSLNAEQVHVDDDGLVRLVLSAQDPGAPNWIDTQGLRRGLFVFRWIWTKTNPVPEGRLVTIDAVRGLLPAGHPEIDPGARRRLLAARRESYLARYL